MSSDIFWLLFVLTVPLFGVIIRSVIATGDRDLDLDGRRLLVSFLVRCPRETGLLTTRLRYINTLRKLSRNKLIDSNVCKRK